MYHKIGNKDAYKWVFSRNSSLYLVCNTVRGHVYVHITTTNQFPLEGRPRQFLLQFFWLEKKEDRHGTLCWSNVVDLIILSCRNNTTVVVSSSRLWVFVCIQDTSAFKDAEWWHNPRVQDFKIYLHRHPLTLSTMAFLHPIPPKPPWYSTSTTIVPLSSQLPSAATA